VRLRTSDEGVEHDQGGARVEEIGIVDLSHAVARRWRGFSITAAPDTIKRDFSPACGSTICGEAEPPRRPGAGSSSRGGWIAAGGPRRRPGAYRKRPARDRRRRPARDGGP